MEYYTITSDGLIRANNSNILEPFGTVLPLPDDYEEGKYIVQDNELVLNPDWEEEKAQKEKQEQINSITEQMELIDKKRIRAVCENELKDEEITWLEYYNSIIKDLREQLSELLK